MPPPSASGAIQSNELVGIPCRKTTGTLVVAGAPQEDRLVVELERRFRHRQQGRPDDSLTIVRTLCFGDALVDLICRRPVSSFEDADAFVPSPGGVIANIATTASMHGAAVSLAGGAGDDPWGAWLR